MSSSGLLDRGRYQQISAICLTLHRASSAENSLLLPLTTYQTYLQVKRAPPLHMDKCTHSLIRVEEVRRLDMQVEFDLRKLLKANQLQSCKIYHNRCVTD